MSTPSQNNQIVDKPADQANIDEQSKADIDDALKQIPQESDAKAANMTPDLSDTVKDERLLSDPLKIPASTPKIAALNASESVARMTQSEMSQRSTNKNGVDISQSQIIDGRESGVKLLAQGQPLLDKDKDEGVTPEGYPQISQGQPFVPYEARVVEGSSLAEPLSQGQPIDQANANAEVPILPPVDVAAISYSKSQAQGGPTVLEELESYSVSSTLNFFFKHSYRDVGRKKCHFCLSFCSVLIVVWAALVVNTLVEKGPVIFLKLSEAERGQYDGIVYPQKDMDFAGFQNNEGVFINYTKSMETLQKSGEEFNLSPRKTFCGSKAGTSYPIDRREEFDGENWFLEEEKDFIKTTDGKNSLPPLQQIKGKFANVEYQYDMCAIFMDTDRERSIQSGLSYKFPRLNEGECVIHQEMADQLGVEVGDIFFIQMDVKKNLKRLMQVYNDVTDNQIITPEVPDRYKQLNVSCRVADIGTGSNGKVGKREAATAVYLEYDYVFTLIANYLPSIFNTLPMYKCVKNGENDFCSFLDWLKQNGTQLAQEQADFMMMTLPTPRVNYYTSSDYLEIQRGVTNYANKIIDGLGFYPIRIDMPVLGMMQGFSQAILMLGLIFDMIILLFIILSVLLIYSLLMISVEAKTFEFGVMRMTGLNKSGIVSMIVIQAFMFVFPSVIIGFGLSFPFLDMTYKQLFSEDMGMDLTPVPSPFSILQALVIGILIPILSSIVPIQTALKKNLNDSLDLQRSKTAAINITILDPNQQNWGSYIVFGLIGVTYGLGIYYFLPLAMLSFNFALILQIFFAILIGMLYGLSLLAFNLQRFMEILLVYVFLFWEKSSMRQMIFKNLTAHKLRNKMTSIIFSISIGFIIFLVVIYRLQIQTTKLLQLQRNGAFFLVEGHSERLTPELMDPILQKHKADIEDFAYLTYHLKDTGFKEVIGSDKARAIQENIEIFGVQPSMFDTLIQDFIDINYRTDSGLSLGEQLYSKRGSQSGATGNYEVTSSNYDLEDHRQYMLLTLKPSGYGKPNRYYKKRVVWTANQIPYFQMRDRNFRKDSSFVVNLPSYQQMKAPFSSLNETTYDTLFIKFKHEGGSDEYMRASKSFVKDCKQTFDKKQSNSIWFDNQFDDNDTMAQVVLILDSIFNVIIVITMLLCLFSLVSSMSANLMDQTKEIGILRAIGFTKLRIKVLYFYEAFILVIASSLLGVMIGTTVAFTMVLQQVVFTQIPLFFFFPWQQFCIIMVMSLICALISSWGPAGNLVKHDIAYIFRSGA